MKEDSLLYKIWRILYPLLLYFLLDLIIVWAFEAVAPYIYALHPAEKGKAAADLMAVATIVFLAASVVVCYILYKRDYNAWSVWIYKKPQYFAAAAVIGILAANGLSTLVSFLKLDNIIGNYSEIEATVFQAHWILTVVQTVLLAPLSEELLFRGILYKRLEKYFSGFWGPALISSALFGLYHMNLAQGVFAFLFGITVCAVYRQMRNLWVPVVMHAAGNLVSVIIVYTGFAFSSEMVYLIVMILSLAAAGALYYFAVRPAGREVEKTI